MSNARKPAPRHALQTARDYTLLLARMEEAVLKDSESPHCRSALAREGVWKQLSPAQAMAWADLARIAGLMDTALDIYRHLRTIDPDWEPAWQAEIELLDILDKGEMLSAVTALACRKINKNKVMSWITRGPEIPVPQPEEPAAGPFEQMHIRRTLVSRFMTLFSGRPDVFARQWAKKGEGKSGYVPVRRPMTTEDLEDHFKGTKTYGFYLMQEDARVCCAVIDADIKPEFRRAGLKAKTRAMVKKDRAYMVSRINEGSSPLGLHPFLEFSGAKGWHFWYFLEKPVPAARIRSLLEGLKYGIEPDLSCFSLEVFPKQNYLSGKGLGNLVKLPLGIHRLSGKRSCFPGCPKTDILSQLSYLDTVKTSTPDSLKSPAPAQEKILVHPELKTLSETYPGLFELSRKCPALGQLIASAREHRPLGAREEKILFQTLGFLPQGRRMLHYLLAQAPDYNPHMVDYKLSRIRGAPLGCRRIHSLTGYVRDYCDLSPGPEGYIHPLLHLDEWHKICSKKKPVSEKIQNLSHAVENMKTAIIQLEKFLD